MKEFMQNNHMYRSSSGQLFYTREYNHNYVIENFKKLRNIILTAQEEFIQYTITEQCTDYVMEDFSNRYKLITGFSMERVDEILQR